MRYEASYNGRLIDIEAKDADEAMTKALHRFQAMRHAVNVWPKRLTPVPSATSAPKI
jgi:hypothetical protein